MSGVYIQGMEMPERCEDCPIEQHDENRYGDEFDHRCGLIYKGYTEEIRMICRHKDCPLVEVPEHGRLIDVDELFKEFERRAWYDNADRDLAEDFLLDAPTVIPASEDGE